MSERQPLHGGPFEPGPQGPAPGPGPPTLLAAQDGGWMVSGGTPYPLLAPQDFAPFGAPPAAFEPQFNKVAPCFPFPPGFGFAAAAAKEADEAKDEGLTARLLERPGDGSPRAGTPAGGVGYRPWEQEGFEGRPPGDKERPFSNGQDKGSPGLQSQDSSQSSERMPTPVDKMAAQHPAAPFPMQHHPFADFPPHHAVFFAADKGSGEEPSFQVPSVSSTTTRHTLLPMAPHESWAAEQQQRNGLAAPPPPPGTPDAMDKGTKKKRKRCGECPGCLKKDNCGECGPCRSVRSHQICKMRKCDQLKTKKEKVSEAPALSLACLPACLLALRDRSVLRALLVTAPHVSTAQQQLAPLLLSEGKGLLVPFFLSCAYETHRGHPAERIMSIAVYTRHDCRRVAHIGGPALRKYYGRREAPSAPYVSRGLW